MWAYRQLFEPLLSFLLSMYPEVELLDPMVVLCLISEESPYHYAQ